MRSLHLTILVFCQVLLASFILYSTVTSASPVVPPKQQQPQQSAPVVPAQIVASPAEPKREVRVIPQLSVPVVDSVNVQKPTQVAPKNDQVYEKKSPIVEQRLTVVLEKAPVVEPKEQHVIPAQAPTPVALAPAVVKEEPSIVVAKGAAPASVKTAESNLQAHPKANQIKPVEAKKLDVPVQEKSPLVHSAPIQPAPAVQSAPTLPVHPAQPVQVAPPVQSALAPPVQPVLVQPVPVQSIPVQSVPQRPAAAEQPASPLKPEVSHKEKLPEVPSKSAPVSVKGGLGPLHLLAATLCNYQPEKLVADETLNLLYSQRAALRKSLFDFMSLKFTNLEKLSSRLNSGFASLEVVPPKKSDEATPGVAPSHGWPVVGVCTAHDLKLMAEAAYCEAAPVAPSVPAPVAPVSSAELDKQEPKIASNRHQSGRSIEQQALVPADQSSVISKLLHVNDIKDAPVIDGSLAALNLTQQQLVSLQQAQAASPRECRRNALRLTKSLFNHLAEDQRQQSESWPKLYAQLNEDECARKRMIDIVTALASFRGETSSIRRDNVEYAFAMDDLRSKVLESEVNTPLTFDKQFIEVEQFLQQSVKLMLANIDPQRARLTSMRYRSLMAGSSASADDQCIELHQRLLAKNYPTDCNPNQFGQLPDVLRMTASSLALYSIEQELAKYSAKFQDYPSAPCAPFVGAPVKQDVSECIANLVAS